MAKSDFDYYKVKVPRKDKNGNDITSDKVSKGGRRRGDGTFSGLAYDFEKFEDNYDCSASDIPESDSAVDVDSLLGILGLSLLGVAIFSRVKKSVSECRVDSEINDEQQIADQIKEEECKEKQRIKAQIRLEKYEQKQQIKKQAKIEKYRLKQQKKIQKMKEKAEETEQKKKANSQNERNSESNTENFQPNDKSNIQITPSTFLTAFNSALNNFLKDTTNQKNQEYLFKMFLVANEISKQLHFIGNISENELKAWNRVFEIVSSQKVVDYINYIIVNNEYQLDSNVMDYVLINFQGGFYGENSLIPINPNTVKNKLYIE